MARFKKTKFEFKRFINMLLIVVISVISSVTLYDMYLKIDTKPDTYTNATRTSANQQVEENKKFDIVDELENLTDSVVGISKIKNIGSSIFAKNSETDLGIGSGVIISQNGYIVTNWHVSGDKYSNCYVTLSDGGTYNGNVVWVDKDLDISIIKINRDGLKHINLGDSEAIKIGQPVYAIGNPIGFEFQRSVTSGIISAKNRTIKIEEDDKFSYMEDLIQTDATINPGNSGGPLIDSNGNMIGINTVKISDAEGIGFAVPINIIKPIINSFLSSNEFNEAYIGIFGYDKEVIPYLDSGVEFDSGIYVAQVALDGPCYTSGIKAGDIITQIDNLSVNKMTELRAYIYTKKPNDIVQLKVLRNKKELNIQVKLGVQI